MSVRLPNPAVRRLIRRELAANRSRTIALFMLTFLPLGFVLLVASISEESAAPLSLGIGQADAVIIADESASAADVVAKLPGTPRTVGFDRGFVEIGQLHLEVSNAPLDDALLVGFSLLDRQFDPTEVVGRLPTAPGEVLISVNVAAVVGITAEVGERFEWTNGTSFEVVGLLPAGENVTDGVLHLFAGADIGTGDRRHTVLADWDGPLPALDQRPTELELPVQILYRDQPEVVSSDVAVPLVSGLLMAGLTIATGAIALAAWASSARKRLHDVALLTASGATPAQATTVQAGQALLVSVAAAVTALVLVWSLGSIRGWHDDVSVAGFAVPIVIAVGAATLAAWWPARRTASLPLATLLSGRVPAKPTRVPSAGGGVIAIVVGLGLLATSITRESATEMLLLGTMGVVAVAFGVVPVISIGFRLLAVAGRGLPTVPRMVLRHTGRHAGRSTASVLAIGAVATTVWLGAVDAQEIINLSSVEATLSDGTQPSVIIADPSAARREQSTDDVIALVGRAGVEQTLKIEAFWSEEIGPFNAIPESLTDGPIAAALNRRGLFGPRSEQPSDSRRDPGQDRNVVVLDAGVDQTVLDQLRADPRFRVETGQSNLQSFGSRGEARTQIVLFGIGVAVSLLIVGYITQLAATEVADDLAVMASVGAGPGFAPRFLGIQAFVHTCVAVLGGLVIGSLIRQMVDTGLPIPWLVLAGLVALPFVAGGSAYAIGTVSFRQLEPNPRAAYS